MYPLTVEVQGGGAVREELIETKSVSYQEGSVVQLTGIPNSYWIFDHWEGAIDSKDNPISIIPIFSFNNINLSCKLFLFYKIALDIF